MDFKRRTFLVASSMTLGLAGCTGDNETTPVEDEEPTAPDETDDEDTEMDSNDQDSGESDSTEVTDDTPTNVIVQVRSHSEHGDILVGPDEMTLYVFERDPQGEGMSSCYDGCADNWPPLTVDDEPVAGDGVTADVTSFERDDGSRQVAVNGWPLYYFAPDQEPGDVMGQGVNDVWWVLQPDGTPIGPDTASEDESEATVQVRSHSEYGDILIGPDEMTLYMFDQDTQGNGASTCYDDCADSWPPLAVEDEPVAGDGVTADLGTFERETGERQVMAGGWPLYYFTPDEEPGDATGQGVNDVWWVLNSDGTPVKPDGGY